MVTSRDRKTPTEAELYGAISALSFMFPDLYIVPCEPIIPTALDLKIVLKSPQPQSTNPTT